MPGKLTISGLLEDGLYAVLSLITFAVSKIEALLVGTFWFSYGRES